MKVARLSGDELCPYCNKLLRAIIRQHIRNLLNTGEDLKDSLNKMIKIIYDTTYSTEQEKIVFFETRPPVLLLDDFFYVSIISEKLTNKFLEEYFKRKRF